jgi:hypothetical protein
MGDVKGIRDKHSMHDNLKNFRKKNQSPPLSARMGTSNRVGSKVRTKDE